MSSFVTQSIDISWEIDVVKDASGSATLKYGNSLCVSSVHGPKSLQKSGNILQPNATLVDCSGVSDVATLICQVKLASHLTNTEFDLLNSNELNTSTQATESYLSIAVKEALESSIQLHKYPKSVVSLNLILLESSDFDLPCLINCASVALVNSGIEMYDIVTSAKVSYSNDTDKPADIIVGYAASLEAVTFIKTYGKLSSIQVTEGVNHASQYCIQIRDMIERKLVGTN